jgi:hypothetical protein
MFDDVESGAYCAEAPLRAERLSRERTPKMRRLILSGIIAGALFASIAGSAFAGSDNHLMPGTPGDANCEGQTIAYVAQGAGGVVDGNGIGGVAKALGISVKDLKALVDSYCNP